MLKRKAVAIKGHGLKWSPHRYHLVQGGYSNRPGTGHERETAENSFRNTRHCLSSPALCPRKQLSRNGDYLVELARLDRESSGVDQYPFITSNPTTTPIIGDIYTEPTEPIHLQQPRARGTPSSDSIIPVDGTGIRSAGVPPNVLL